MNEGQQQPERIAIGLDREGAGSTPWTEHVRSTGGEALAVPTDISEEASTAAMAAAVLGRYGRIDILANNAAVFATIPISRVVAEEIPLEEWDLVLRVNLRGPFLASRAVLPATKTKGYGRIVNISSGTVFEGAPTRLHYVTSKAGIIGFTRTFAREVGAARDQRQLHRPGSTLSEERLVKLVHHHAESSTAACWFERRAGAEQQFEP